VQFNFEKAATLFAYAVVSTVLHHDSHLGWQVVAAVMDVAILFIMTLKEEKKTNGNVL
jgi:hypothetical protein